MNTHIAKERPIPMSSPNIKPILEDRKTQTRRIVKKDSTLDCLNGVGAWDGPGEEHEWLLRQCPYGQREERLWVKEAWRTEVDSYDHLAPSEMSGKEKVIYEADGCWSDNHTVGRYRHARFMPRWASRILLEITDVRVERLQDISEADAKAEGVSFGNITDQATGEIDCDAVEAYEQLWESINGDGSWDANPWVWVICFKRIEL